MSLSQVKVIMSSAHEQIWFFLDLPNCCRVRDELRRGMNVSRKLETRLLASRKRKQGFLNGVIRRYLFTDQMQECRFQQEKPVTSREIRCPAANDSRGHNEFELKEMQNETNNLGDDQGSNNGNGNNGGNDNDNSNGEGGHDDESEDYSNDGTTGLEWWWWWKWQQVRYRSSQTAVEIAPLWPVDAAVQVMANGVIQTIEPAVRAIVLKPFMQQISMQGLIMVLFIGAFVVSCLEMVAGLAVVSMGISLAIASSLVLALLWWLRQKRPSHDQNDNDNDTS